MLGGHRRGSCEAEAGRPIAPTDPSIRPRSSRPAKDPARHSSAPPGASCNRNWSGSPRRRFPAALHTKPRRPVYRHLQENLQEHAGRDERRACLTQAGTDCRHHSRQGCRLVQSCAVSRRHGSAATAVNDVLTSRHGSGISTSCPRQPIEPRFSDSR